MIKDKWTEVCVYSPHQIQMRGHICSKSVKSGNIEHHYQTNQSFQLFNLQPISFINCLSIKR